MAVINVAPLYMRHVQLTVGTDDYQKHVSAVTLTPSNPTQTWKGLDQNVVTATGSPTWTVEISYVQDWSTTNSLSDYLWDNQGTTKAMTFEPEDGGQAFTATVLIVHGAVGGQVDTFAATTVSLPVEGQPTKV